MFIEIHHVYSVHCKIGAAFVHNITFGNFRQYVYLTLKGLNTAVLHSTYYTVMLSSPAGRRSAPPEGMGGGRKSQMPEKNSMKIGSLDAKLFHFKDRVQR